MAKYGGANYTPGDNARYMTFQMALMMMPRIDLQAPDAYEKLEEHCQRFFEICTEHDQRAGQANFALSLHLTRAQFQNRLAGRPHLAEDVHDLLMQMNASFGASVEDGMLSGQTNTVGSIFISKNNYGYRDQTEQIVVHQHQGLTAEELKQIADGLPDVIDADYSEVEDPKQIETSS